MPNGGVHVVTIEVAFVFAVLSFVVGFFINLLTMRKMFVANSAFKEHKELCEKACANFRTACEQCNGVVYSGIKNSFKEVRKDIERLEKASREQYGTLRAIAAHLGVDEEIKL